MPRLGCVPALSVSINECIEEGEAGEFDRSMEEILGVRYSKGRHCGHVLLTLWGHRVVYAVTLLSL